MGIASLLACIFLCVLFSVDKVGAHVHSGMRLSQAFIHAQTKLFVVSPSVVSMQSCFDCGMLYPTGMQRYRVQRHYGILHARVHFCCDCSCWKCAMALPR